MAYVIAAYAIAIVGLCLYGFQLWRERRTLLRLLRATETQEPG
jgi:hypothetical protein